MRAAIGNYLGLQLPIIGEYSSKELDELLGKKIISISNKNNISIEFINFDGACKDRGDITGCGSLFFVIETDG